MGIGWTLRDNDWNKLRQILQQIAGLRFGPNSSPSFTDISANSLTLTRLGAGQAVMTDSNKKLITADYLNQAVKSTSSPVFSGLTAGTIEATSKFRCNGTDAAADGTYTVGIGSTQNGTITIKGGIIVAVQEAI